MLHSISCDDNGMTLVNLKRLIQRGELYNGKRFEYTDTAWEATIERGKSGGCMHSIAQGFYIAFGCGGSSRHNESDGLSSWSREERKSQGDSNDGWEGRSGSESESGSGSSSEEESSEDEDDEDLIEGGWSLVNRQRTSVPALKENGAWSLVLRQRGRKAGSEDAESQDEDEDEDDKEDEDEDEDEDEGDDDDDGNDERDDRRQISREEPPARQNSRQRPPSSASRRPPPPPGASRRAAPRSNNRFAAPSGDGKRRPGAATLTRPTSRGGPTRAGRGGGAVATSRGRPGRGGAAGAAGAGGGGGGGGAGGGAARGKGAARVTPTRRGRDAAASSRGVGPRKTSISRASSRSSSPGIDRPPEAPASRAGSSDGDTESCSDTGGSNNSSDDDDDDDDDDELSM